MALHDWTQQPGWEGVHLFWMTDLARWLKAHLPPGYRAIIGASPLLTIRQGKPDVSVLNGRQSAKNNSSGQVSQAGPSLEPDYEAAVATLEEEDVSVLIEREQQLVAAIELVSPQNKDRPASRELYTGRYLSYLRAGVHLLLVDVHRLPAAFSFPERIAQELDLREAPPSPPHAVSYRVGGNAATGGRMLAVWQRVFEIGGKLPTIPLALSLDDQVFSDLDSTYTQAAGDAYLE